MIKLFKLGKEQVPELSDEAKLIKEFKEIWSRLRTSKGDSDGRKKFLNTKELGYIYWEGSYGSTYKVNHTDNKERLEKLKEDLELPSDWKPDEAVYSAINKLEELNRTPTMRIVESQLLSIQKLTQYLEDTDLTETIEGGAHKGELVNDPTKYMKVSENLTVLVKAYKENEKIIEEEIAEKTANRGGRKSTEFNE